MENTIDLNNFIRYLSDEEKLIFLYLIKINLLREENHFLKNNINKLQQLQPQKPVKPVDMENK